MYYVLVSKSIRSRTGRPEPKINNTKTLPAGHLTLTGIRAQRLLVLLRPFLILTHSTDTATKIECVGHRCELRTGPSLYVLYSSFEVSTRR